MDADTKRIRLKFVAYIEMGQSPPSKTYSDLPEAGLPFFQGTSDFGQEEPTPKSYCASPTKVAKSGDLLFSVRAPVGEINRLAFKAGIGRGLCAIRPESVDSNYLWWALAEARERLNLVATGSTYEAVSSEDVANLPIVNHETTIQRVISNFLDQEIARLDSLVCAKEHWLNLLAEKRHAIIAQAVTRGLVTNEPLRDSGIPWLGKIPVTWRLKRAKFLFSKSSLPVQEDDDIVTCFRDGQVTLRKNRREGGFTNAILELGYQGIQEGQLVLHSMDAFAGAIGISDSNGKCSPEYIICDPIGPAVVSEYYGRLLRVMALAGYIQASCPAVRERAPRIRFPDFGDMILPVPPADEQITIVEHITTQTSQIDLLRAATERSIALLKERRAALIAAAVTGQLDIPEVA